MEMTKNKARRREIISYIANNDVELETRRITKVAKRVKQSDERKYRRKAKKLIRQKRLIAS